MNDSLTFSSSGLTNSGHTLSGTIYPSTTYISTSTPLTNLHIKTNMNQPVQNKVAVFKVTRNDKNEITSTEFLKEMWVETKNNQRVEFVVARDKDLAKYNDDDLSIRVILSVTF